VRARLAVHEVQPAVAELRELAARPDLGDLRGPVLLWQADIALARKTDAAGLALAREALSHPLPPADRAYARGLLAETLPAALGRFREALAHDPYHHRARGMVALLLIVLGEIPEAESVATLGTRFFPEDPTFPVLLSVVRAWEGRSDEAVGGLNHRRSAAAEALRALARANESTTFPPSRTNSSSASGNSG
jgi:hypothetical protein